MDIKIDNRDILLDGKNAPVMIDGIQQILQQIKIALAVKKGSFIYDRNMGTELSREVILAENGAKTLQAILYEGLINVDVDMKVDYIKNDNNIIYAGISIENEYEKMETEVIVFE